MKQLTSVFLLTLILSCSLVQAAYLHNVPTQMVQPNGDILNCFASGDEFFNYLHDADGYTIIQHPQTGYYVYAQKENGILKATSITAGVNNPAAKGLVKNARISAQQWIELREEIMLFEDAVQESTHRPFRAAASVSSRNKGVLNNLVVFIRFSDETSFSANFNVVEQNFNDSATATNTSLYNYFKATSYGQLAVPSTFYPAPNDNVIVSYQDSLPRSYYEPYNATTNVNGYQDQADRTTREHGLLERAIAYIEPLVPTSLDIDYNNDGRVDNICFIVKGSPNGWSTLLWPHRWSLYSINVTLHGKRVYDYNLTLETQMQASTLCHEMQHTLSYPDLYHYNDDYSSLAPVSRWDVMEVNMNPPQMSGAYMKWKYGNWMSQPVEANVPGTYTINSLGSGTGNMWYKIPSDDPTQFFVLEYRNPTDNFDTSIPGTGILVYRINTNYNGNASYNGDDILDEVYIYRPNANDMVSNGTPLAANFGVSTRTTFDSLSNPRPFMSDGSFYNELKIANMSYSGATATFTIVGEANEPQNFNIDSITDNTITLSWLLNNNLPVMLLASTNPITTTLNSGVNYTVGQTLATGETVLYAGTATSFRHINLTPATNYYYKLVTKVNNTPLWTSGINLQARTECGLIQTLPYLEDFETNTELPSCFQLSYISGSNPWEIATGTTSSGSIKTAYSGVNNMSLYFAAYTNPTTRFVLPTFNLQNYQGSEVKLSFWYTMPVWGGDQDELTIYYKNSEQGNWIALQTFNQSITTWTQAQITLPYLTDFYQIAFDGTAKYGYGITIDDIKVDVTPYTLYTTAMPLQGGQVSDGGEFVHGTTATLTAIENQGYTFCSWSDGETANPRNITMVSDTIIAALFCQLPSAVISATDTIVCQGSLTVLSVPNADSIYWYANQTELTAMRNQSTINVYPTTHTSYSAVTINQEVLSGLSLSSSATGYRDVFVNPTYSMPQITANVYVGDLYNNHGWYIDTQDSTTGSFVYQRVDQTIDGCDSTLNLLLNIISLNTATLYDTICENQLPYLWNGITFQQEGIQTRRFTAANGTDSVLVLNLKVNPVYLVSREQTICETQLPYTWNGYTFTQMPTETYSVTLQSQAGCDSVVNMTLHVLPTKQESMLIEICPSDLPYTWNDSVFTQSGTKTAHLTAKNGCDSTLYMQVEVLPTYRKDTFVTANNSYVWNEFTYTETSIYEINHHTDAGCDSIESLNLIINTTETAINELSTQVNIVVYPNPANSYVMIDNIQQFIGKTLIITDKLGNQIISRKITMQPMQIRIDTLPSGMYIIWIDNIALKIIKI